MKSYFSKILILLFFTSFFSLLPSCNKDERIPYVYVDFVIYPDLPQYLELKTPGNFLYLTGGYRGIIMYCDYTDSYKAYDRCCTYEPTNSNAILDVDSTGLFLVCRNCQSKFLLLDGSVVEGPAKYYLTQYATYLDGNALHVYNGY